MTVAMPAPARAVPVNKASTVLFASLIGTTIEFFDFYIYANAAVLVFPRLFFPAGDASAAMLQSLATFAIAFIARPIGSAIFGHFGDRIGRKATLVAALLTMGVSTVLIGCLPTYASIGTWAPLLLAICRFGQGLGLGGEWGGAVLLATENAPPAKRAWYGMFPQLGAPIGFFLAGGSFLLLSTYLSDAEFFAYGWRIPFLSSTVLVAIGLYIRLKLTETPAFQDVIERNERVKVPVAVVLRDHGSMLFMGTVAAIATFAVFYLMTVFALSWGTTALHYTRPAFLKLQLLSVVFFGMAIPLSAVLADKYGRRATMVGVNAVIALYGFALAPLFGSGDIVQVGLFMCVGMGLMGMTYGPLGTLLSELFPAAVRYTGASLTFNLAGILGASVAPLIATSLAKSYGLGAVGWYLTGVSLLSLVALMFTRSHKTV